MVGNDDDARRLVDDLRRVGIEIGPGLTAARLEAIEGGHGFRFPPDLRALLAAGVPTGDRFPDWHGPSGAIQDLLDAPLVGLVYDVEHNDLWLDAWGPRPAEAAGARVVAAGHLATAPALIPVWAHRYLPAEPPAVGNPVLSVMQGDVVVYGVDLADYLAREFGTLRTRAQPPEVTATPFWSQLLS